jgi:fimbrial isopeptide formation D2 family protein/LPXTG-motif cell wall-anchored protein
MKFMKKMMAFVIAMVMVLAMALPAMADPQNVDLNINAVDGHTYTAYQLFTGDLADDGVTLSNVKWGANVASSITYEDADGTKTITPVVGDVVPQAVLDYLAGLNAKTATDPAQSTANIVDSWVAGTGFAITKEAKSVLTGYYVVRDAYTNPENPQDTTISTVMAQVVGPTTLTPKAGTTEHKKEVLDINDTTDVALDLSNLQNVDASKWSASADHDFGDHVPFKLTTTIGSDFAKYNSYYLAVSDNLYDGLVLDQDSIKVYVDGELAVEGTEAGQYVLTKTGTTFKVEFGKLNGNAKAAAGKDVVVYYTATLDADSAVIGNPGNWNESFAEFSNNPNGDQTGTGKTPTVTAVVFTYKTVVNKIDKDKNPLVGAEFTLTKKLKDGSTAAVALIKYNKDGTVTTKTANGTSTSEGDATKFSFNGLDDGVYILTETVTPDGYNTIDPITFQVVATHKKTERTGDVETLEVKNEDGSAFTGLIEFTPVAAQGTISTDIVNQSGATLPSTGGIGTTIFYVIGGVLVVLAGIVLVTRRKSAE